MEPWNAWCGYKHSICLDDSGFVWTCGSNSFGQLGHSNYQNLVFFTKIECLVDIILVSCGKVHSICLDKNGNVWGFGNNQCGQLCDCSIIPRDVITPTIINGLTNIIYIVCGGYHTLCLDNNNNIWSFGSNDNGQLGHGHTNNISIPTKINNLSDIKLMDCGGYHSICVDYNGVIYVFGYNNYYQLGLKEQKNVLTPSILNNNFLNNEDIKQISCGWQFTTILTNNGILYTFGYNNSCQLGYSTDINHSLPTKIDNLPIIANISSGYQHTICISDLGVLYSYGCNSNGQCGFTENENIIQKPQEISFIKSYSTCSRGGTSCFIKGIDNDIYVCGDNSSGQIGITNKQHFNEIQKLDKYSHIMASTAKIYVKSARK